MATISTKIKEYAKANGVELNDLDFFKGEKVLVRDDMVDGISNPYIDIWNLNIPKPTDEQLASYETSANIAETNEQVIYTRKQLYGSWESQLEEIYDNGIDAWKTRIAQIKTNNPKQ